MTETVLGLDVKDIIAVEIFPMNYEFGRDDGLTRNTGTHCEIEKRAGPLICIRDPQNFYRSYYPNFHFKPCVYTGHAVAVMLILVLVLACLVLANITAR